MISRAVQRVSGAMALGSASASRAALQPVRRISARRFSSNAGGEDEPTGFNPETPKQRMLWLSSLGAISAATAYFLYRVYTDYYTEGGRHAAAEKVMSTPLYKGNPVVFMDVEKDGKQLGRMVFQLRKDVVPDTVENFRQLFTGECGRSYKGTSFHHVLPANYAVGGNVPAEGGKPEAAGGGYFPDENFALLHNGAGVLSSASQIRDENGSLFFVTLNKAPNLNGRYVAFGSLLEGEDVLQALGSAGDSVGNPTAKVSIAACGELRLPEGMEAVAPPAQNTQR